MNECAMVGLNFPGYSSIVAISVARHKTLLSHPTNGQILPCANV